MDFAALLSSHGLRGGFQVHEAPVFLHPDLRAHQVFIGFEAEFVRAKLSRLMDAVELIEAGDEGLIVPAVSHENPGGLYGLVWIVDRLLGPGGCPWDQEQTHESLVKCLLEEAYELVAAIENGDEEAMQEELGDVLLQPIMHAQMEALEGGLDSDTVARAITEKLYRRHPHVFGESDAKDAGAVLAQWDQIKRAEKCEAKSILDGVPPAMPALLRALEVSKRAARAGFEWPDTEGVWEKVAEEEREFRAALANEGPERAEAELGDLLFTLVNVARWAKIDPERALRRMVDRFTARFNAMEARSLKSLGELSPEEWDDLWNQVKREVR